MVLLNEQMSERHIANLSRRLVGFDLQGRIQLQRAGNALELPLTLFTQAHSWKGSLNLGKMAGC